MRRRFILSTLLAFSPSLGYAAGKVDPDPKSLEIPSETAIEARTLVEKLASKSFQEREHATRELQRLGRLALPAITEAMRNSPNPEVQLRTELLLPSARTDDFRARIDCFLADTEGKYRHDLPGAKEFFTVAGQSDAARNLFRDIVLSPNRDLLLGVGKPDELPKLIAERRAEFIRSINGGGVVIINGVVQNNKNSAPTVTDLAAIFFAESMIPEKKLGGQAGYQAASLINQPALRTAISGGPEKDAVLGILSKWADTREEPMTMYYAMNYMKTAQPSLSLKLATRLIDTKGGQPLYRGYAITTLGQHGGAEHRATLVKLLKDEAEVTAGIAGVGAKRSPIQVRDLALAMLLLATKQDTTEYGFTYRYKSNPSSDTLKYNYMAHYFDGDDAAKKREDALKKWDEWHAKNKDALKK